MIDRRWVTFGACSLIAGYTVVTRLREPAPAVLSQAVHAVSIEDATTHWEANGYTRMVAPVRPPTSSDLRARIIVYLKLPEHGTVTARFSPTTRRWSLDYPEGTIADRVEYIAPEGTDIDDPPNERWRVADVRGTLLSKIFEFHVYRAKAGTPQPQQQQLFGVAWPDSDDAAQREATRIVGTWMADEESSRHIRGINGCAACHVRDRAARLPGEPGIVNRGTDAAGFFHVPTILADEAPIETYRPRDSNLGDPFVQFTCGPARAPALRIDGVVRCPSGEIPVGVMNVAAAMQAGDRHAEQVCASRRALFDRLDDAAKQVHRGALAACSLK